MNVVNIVKEDDGINKESSNSSKSSQISFSFKNNNNLANSPLSNKRKEPEKQNFITSLEGNKITSTITDDDEKPKQPKVIPLSQQRHTSYKEDVNSNNNNDNNNNKNNEVITKNITKDDKLNLEQQSNNSKNNDSDKRLKIDKDNLDNFDPKKHGLQVKEKTQEIKSLLNSIKDNNNDEEVKVKPLIEKLDGLDRFTNEDDKFRFDMNSRPDQADDDDYEETPIGIFGEAMLRGMGWEPGQAIGLTNKGLNEPIQFVKRPGYRLGLGAKPKDVDDKDKKYLVAAEGEDGRVRHIVGINEKLVELKSGFTVGDKVLVIAGQHEGMYAEVDSLPQGNDKIVVIFKSNERAVVDKSDIQLLEKTKSNSNNRSSNSSNNNNGNKQPIKSIGSSSSSSNSSNNNKYEDNEPMWLRSNILVKIVSKSLGDGKYYNKKAKVLDIIGEKLCCLELDNGTVLENIKQRMVETAIPREKGSSICVVQGKNRGRLGSLIERTVNSKKRDIAIVQLVGDLSVQEFDLDDICQYVGNRDHEYHT